MSFPTEVTACILEFPIVVAYKIVYHVVCIELACVTPLSLGSDVLLFARCVHS